MENGKLSLIRLILSLSALLLAGVQESRAQDITIETIALSTDAGLSTGDPVIGVGGNVAIDSAGKVMFFVTTESNGMRKVHLAMSDGTSASLLPGFDFLDFSKPRPILNASGTVAFPWFEGIEVGSRNGVFIGTNLGNLGFIDADSLALPGSTEANVFVAAGRPALNRSGVVAFATGFTSAGNQPSEPTNGVFFGTSSGGMTRIVLAGEQARGTAVGTVFDTVSLPFINDRGDIAFFGRLQLAAGEVATEGETGIWLYSSQTAQVQLVARAGATPLPGMEDGSNFMGISGPFGIDSAGKVLFEATFAPPRLVPRTQLWRGSSPDTLEPLFGVTKPSSLGFDAEPQVKDDVVITGSGDLVFQSGSLRVVDGVIHQQARVKGAIWKDTGALLEVVIHVGLGPVGAELPGSDAPGTGGTFTGSQAFTVNGPGAVAFISQYEVGGIPAAW